MPRVSAIIATRNRPDMLREAIASVLGQSFVGFIEVLVVYDQSVPDASLAFESATRSVRVLPNARQQGLAGARNTGIEAATGDFVAFCDDDDYWLPEKVTAQLQALAAHPGAELASCDICVHYDGESHRRRLGRSLVTFAELLRDRHTELHPSTFLMRRDSVVQGFGLVSEVVPGGFGEDYEFLLRIARRNAVVHVESALAVVRWGGQSFFFQRWQTMSDGLSWILEQYPEFERSPAGSARLRGQIAFAQAALGQWNTSLRWAASATRRNPFELRAVLAVACRLVGPERVMQALHRRGRGI
ncbi:glycosyltransferase family 2 protein [Arthrobacter sp. STN4]|uniref:glycosyltransferase family 2 protein n=1 Tax=Arthrobacter sp. STN4 TaxID=2923276 RepID=UPI00211A4412|nr:glycosyltransferase family 2 protein [Arthrobacter sp. STN4]MCQ9163643.1 glycosyltransferase [Arthrobacter sp. STN4]